jgi:hypothetical protein
MRLAATLVLSLLITPAVASAAPPDAAKSPPQIAAYWTKERMRSAVPREMGRAGEPRPVAGKPPKGGTTSTWTRLAVSLPYAGDDLNNGKVFFTLAGVNYVCSGTSVAATNVNLVWTAGHCVNEGPGDYATNFMFAPGYVDGTTPHGRWTASSSALATTAEWRTDGDFDFDFGAARVVLGSGAPTGVTSLAQVASPRAMSFGYTVTTGSTKFKSYGYPAAGKFNGQRMYLCDSTVTRRDGSGSGAPMGIGCDMTGGSSGGGWVDTVGKVSSVNSYHYRSIKNVMFGPYQGSVAQSLYQSMD